MNVYVYIFSPLSSLHQCGRVTSTVVIKIVSIRTGSNELSRRHFKYNNQANTKSPIDLIPDNNPILIAFILVYITVSYVYVRLYK